MCIALIGLEVSRERARRQNEWEVQNPRNWLVHLIVSASRVESSSLGVWLAVLYWYSVPARYVLESLSRYAVGKRAFR
jgi:hypothetical protein